MLMVTTTVNTNTVTQNPIEITHDDSHRIPNAESVSEKDRPADSNTTADVLTRIAAVINGYS